MAIQVLLTLYHEKNYKCFKILTFGRIDPHQFYNKYSYEVHSQDDVCDVKPSAEENILEDEENSRSNKTCDSMDVEKELPFISDFGKNVIKLLKLTLENSLRRNITECKEWDKLGRKFRFAAVRKEKIYKQLNYA